MEAASAVQRSAFIHCSICAVTHSLTHSLTYHSGAVSLSVAGGGAVVVLSTDQLTHSITHSLTQCLSQSVSQSAIDDAADMPARLPRGFQLPAPTVSLYTKSTTVYHTVQYYNWSDLKSQQMGEWRILEDSRESVR